MRPPGGVHVVDGTAHPDILANSRKAHSVGLFAFLVRQDRLLLMRAVVRRPRFGGHKSNGGRLRSHAPCDADVGARRRVDVTLGERPLGLMWGEVVW